MKKLIGKQSLIIAMMLISSCATTPVSNVYKVNDDVKKVSVSNSVVNHPTIKISDRGADISFNINISEPVLPFSKGVRGISSLPSIPKRGVGGEFSTKANTDGKLAKTSANINKYIVYLISTSGNYSTGGDPLADIVPGTSPTTLTSGGLTNVRFSGVPFSAKTYYVAIQAQDSSNVDLVKPNNAGVAWTGSSAGQPIAVSASGVSVNASLVVTPAAALSVNLKLLDGTGAKIEAGISVTNGSPGFTLTANSNSLTTTTLVSTGLTNPFGVALDSSGDLYIADSGNNRVLKRDTATGLVTTPIANGDGLLNPRGVAVDRSGNVYIADTNNNRVLKRDNAGLVTILVSGVSGLNRPIGVAVDSSGNLYIADIFNNRILKSNPAGTNVTTLIANGDGLDRPYGVAVDSSGNVYIADTFNNAIKKRDTATGLVTILVSGLNLPMGVTVDSSGNLYIADTYNHAIKKRDTNGVVTTLVSTGLSFPTGVAVNSSGNVYIADFSSSTIKMIND